MYQTVGSKPKSIQTMKLILTSEVLVMLLVSSIHCIENPRFPPLRNTSVNRKSATTDSRVQFRAYFPNPDEDGTFLLVNLGDPPRRESQTAEKLQDEAVKFHLYTSDADGNEYESEIIPDQNADPSWLMHFKPNASLKILCHGYKSSPEKPFSATMRRFLPLPIPLPLTLPPVLADSVNVNVVVMGWEALSRSDFYLEAVKNMRFVSEKTVKMLEYLKSYSAFRLEDTHFIGHNLGAHIGGIVGELLQSKRVGKMGRITALDPAGLRDCSSTKDRLDASDAIYVDAVHTDDGEHCGADWLKPDSSNPHARGALERNWGYGAPVGHADFYPDAGRIESWRSMDSCGPCNSYRYLLAEALAQEEQRLSC